MDEPFNICKYFADIEANPYAKTPNLTVRQFLRARAHVYGCDVCFGRVERVLARAPEEKLPEPGEN